MTVTKLHKENGIKKPVCFNVLQAMKLMLDIESRLAGNESVIAYSIKLAVKMGRPAVKIIEDIQEMIAQNYNCMADVFGSTRFTDEIKNFK